MAEAQSDPSEVMKARFKKNLPALATDILLGVAFFIVAKLTDLTTAALFGAGAGLALIVIQRFVSVDLLGGLALYGVVLMGVSAVFALLAQDDVIIKLRTSFVGGVSGALFLLDGLAAKGTVLGGRMQRYMPFPGVNLQRLSLGVAFVSLTLAAVNIVLALYAPENIWLFYTTFGDIILAVALLSLLGKYIGFAPPNPAP